jgi:hypothetical protein
VCGAFHSVPVSTIDIGLHAVPYTRFVCDHKCVITARPVMSPPRALLHSQFKTTIGLRYVFVQIQPR